MATQSWGTDGHAWIYVYIYLICAGVLEIPWFQPGGPYPRCMRHHTIEDLWRSQVIYGIHQLLQVDESWAIPIVHHMSSHATGLKAVLMNTNFMYTVYLKIKALVATECLWLDEGRMTINLKSVDTNFSMNIIHSVSVVPRPPGWAYLGKFTEFPWLCTSQ